MKGGAEWRLERLQEALSTGDVAPRRLHELRSSLLVSVRAALTGLLMDQGQHQQARELFEMTSKTPVQPDSKEAERTVGVCMRFLPEDGHSQKAVKLDETCLAEAHAPVGAMLELAYALSPVLRKVSGEEILSLVNTTPHSRHMLGTYTSPGP